MSISRKLSLAFTSVLLIFSVLLLVLDNLFLNRFYILQRRKDLKNIYQDVSSLIREEGIDEASRDNLINEYMVSTGGVRILLFNSDGEVLNSPVDFSLAYLNIKDEKGSRVDTKEEYDQYLPQAGMFIQFDDVNGDRMNRSRNIAIVGKAIKNNAVEGYILAFTPLASLSNTIEIINTFILFTTVIVLLIALLVSFIFSFHFVKPLKDVEATTRKIANLDFSSKLPITSSDEIGSLSLSINKMSSELERNIDELKKANAKLQEDLELKERINKFKEEFISDVSHELKTPISIISGYSEALKLEGLTNEDLNEYADIIIDESKRMNKLVRDLIKYTQIESGFLTLEEEEFNISDIIESVIRPQEKILEEKRIELKVDCVSKNVVGDYDMMEIVLQNYVSNAIHYVSLDMEISIKGEVVGDKYRLSVYNSGQQIDPDKIDRIWDSFYKADKARTRSYGGSGLGLSIVKSIMEAYSNKYGVINKDNGVEFYYELNLGNNENE